MKKENLVDNPIKDYKIDCLKQYNLNEHFKLWAEKYSNKVAIVEENIKVTYRELDEKIINLASGFFNLGIKKGDNVVVQLPNSINFITTCFALFRIGAVPVIAVPALREIELDNIFNCVNPVAYIKPKSFLGFEYNNIAKELQLKHPSLKFILTDEEYEDTLKLNKIDLNSMNFHDISCDDIALLLLSGGTTSIPKLIPVTHGAFAYHLKTSAERCKMTENSVYLAILSVGHKLTLFSPGVMGTLSVGGKIVMSKSTSCEEIFKLIEKEKVTITGIVPQLVKMWLEVLEWDKSYDISTLEVLLVGGSLLEEDIARKITSNIHCKLQQVYGMSEGIVCYTSLEDLDEVVCSCQGKPLSKEDNIKIIDKNGNCVQEGEKGQLIVKGPYRFKGYYNSTEDNSKFFTKDGFFYTGDIGRITKEGNIKIEGRIKDQINRAGEKVMSYEIEEYIKKYPKVHDAVVISVEDEFLGERICAFLLVKDKDVNLMNLRRYLNNLGIAKYKIPDEIKIIPNFPHTGAGKIDKKKLKQLALIDSI